MQVGLSHDAGQEIAGSGSGAVFGAVEAYFDFVEAAFVFVVRAVTDHVLAVDFFADALDAILKTALFVEGVLFAAGLIGEDRRGVVYEETFSVFVDFFQHGAEFQAVAQAGVVLNGGGRVGLSAGKVVGGRGERVWAAGCGLGGQGGYQAGDVDGVDGDVAELGVNERFAELAFACLVARFADQHDDAAASGGAGAQHVHGFIDGVEHSGAAGAGVDLLEGVGDLDGIVGEALHFLDAVIESENGSFTLFADHVCADQVAALIDLGEDRFRAVTLLNHDNE